MNSIVNVSFANNVHNNVKLRPCELGHSTYSFMVSGKLSLGNFTESFEEYMHNIL